MLSCLCRDATPETSKRWRHDGLKIPLSYVEHHTAGQKTNLVKHPRNAHVDKGLWRQSVHR